MGLEEGRAGARKERRIAGARETAVEVGGIWRS